MNAILENVVQPIIRRLGTAAAVWLVAEGWDSALVERLVNGLAAALLVGVDLLLARYYKRALITKLIGFDLASPFGPYVGPDREDL